jgi:transmembrane sensor
MNEQESIEAEAADWLARIDRGLDGESVAAFELWKAVSTERRITFLRLQAVWQRADRLAAMRRPQEAAPAAPRRLHRAAAMAAVLVMCVGLGAGYLEIQKAAGEQFETAVGAQRSLQLADGTHVELNTDTLIHTSMAAGTRTVRLDRGQAYFEVVHDARHPFVVLAGNRRITDLGTKFSVFRDGDRVEVVVKEGQVRIDLVGNGAANAPAAAPVVAERNMVVIARNTETLVAMKPPQEIDNEMLWRSGMLVFSQETLADVVDDINRYNVRKIEVVGQARDIRIGGSFRSDNIDGFKQLLRDGFGLKIVEADDKIVISN